MGLEQIAIYGLACVFALLIMFAGIEHELARKREMKTQPLPIEWSNIRTLQDDIQTLNDFLGQWVPVVEGRMKTVEKHLDGGLNPLTMTPMKHVHFWVDVSAGPNLQVLACRCGEEQEIAL